MTIWVYRWKPMVTWGSSILDILGNLHMRILRWKITTLPRWHLYIPWAHESSEILGDFSNIFLEFPTFQLIKIMVPICSIIFFQINTRCVLSYQPPTSDFCRHPVTPWVLHPRGAGNACAAHFDDLAVAPSKVVVGVPSEQKVGNMMFCYFW